MNCNMEKSKKLSQPHGNALRSKYLTEQMWDVSGDRSSSVSILDAATIHIVAVPSEVAR